tara:strand:+ start:127314 stop:128549 length:1236 start_codon:yes stop_codon:yes gene_type:complete
VLKKNFSFSTITTISRLVSGFFLVFILARFLSTEDFGRFTYSLVFANILVLIVDYGYNLKLSTDISKNTINICSLTWNSFKVKIFLTIFVFIILLSLKFLNFPSDNVYSVFLILTFSSIFNSIANHFLIPYRNIDKFEIESKYAFANNLILLIAVILTLSITQNILHVSFSFLLVKIVYSSLTIRKFLNDFGFKNQSVNLISELKDGIPYAIHIAVGAILLNIDTIILREFVSDSEVGLYQAGMRALGACTIGLGILNSVSIPKLSSLVKNNRNQLILLATKLNFGSIFIGLLISIFINIFSEELIHFVYGQKFEKLSNYVFYFSIIIFLRYFSIIYGVVLTISDQQKVRTYCVTIALLFIIISDFFVIPKYKLVGALYILISAHLIILFTYMLFAFRKYKTTFLNFSYDR